MLLQYRSVSEYFINYASQRALLWESSIIDAMDKGKYSLLRTAKFNCYNDSIKSFNVIMVLKHRSKLKVVGMYLWKDRLKVCKGWMRGACGRCESVNNESYSREAGGDSSGQHWDTTPLGQSGHTRQHHWLSLSISPLCSAVSWAGHIQPDSNFNHGMKASTIE